MSGQSLNDWEQDNIRLLTSKTMGEWLGRRDTRLLEEITKKIQGKADNIPYGYDDRDDGMIKGLEEAIEIIDWYKPYREENQNDISSEKVNGRRSKEN